MVIECQTEGTPTEIQTHFAKYVQEVCTISVKSC